MIKILFGNAVFGAIIWGYWVYVQGDLKLFIPGTILASIAFMAGTLIGYMLAPAQVKVKKPRKPPRTPSPREFDEIIP